MIAVLLAINLLITPSTKTDVALSCTDPGEHRPYRVPASWLDEEAAINLSIGRSVTTSGFAIGFPPTGWVFVRRADAVCVEVPDHFSHWSKYWGSRHTHRDHTP